MNQRKQANRTIGLLVLLLCGVRAVSASGRLDIYLPRDVTVSREIIRLSEVALLQGPKDLCDKAGAVRLGQFALPGQTIRLDRVTFLSRLAAVGIDAKRVSLSGAKTVSVSREGSGIGPEGLTDMARTFLEETLKPQGLIEARPMGRPDPIPASESKVEVVPALADRSYPGRQTVLLSIRQDGRETHRVSIPFRVRFRVRRPAAAAAIPAGREITAAAIRMEETESREPLTLSAEAVVGMIAQRDIPAGTVIEPHWLKQKTPPILIERRQKVILRYERGPLVITAAGEAMDEGRVGDVVRVKRGGRRDERIVVGTVRPDGSVEPML